jgi:hypothetical protein
MNFYIGADSGSGQEFTNKEDFLKELSLMIDDCEANGGTQFDITVDADASCFYNEDKDENDLQNIEECEHRDTTNTSYDEYYERDMCFCNVCQCYMSKEECLKDCPLC